MMRRTISSQTWQQIKTAHASGIGLREIARNMGIPEGTVLARALREGWTRDIRSLRGRTSLRSMLVGRSDIPLKV